MLHATREREPVVEREAGEAVFLTDRPRRAECEHLTVKGQGVAMDLRVAGVQPNAERIVRRPFVSARVPERETCETIVHGDLGKVLGHELDALLGDRTSCEQYAGNYQSQNFVLALHPRLDGGRSSLPSLAASGARIGRSWSG